MTDREQERAAIVAFLRSGAAERSAVSKTHSDYMAHYYNECQEMALRHAADAIERGAHLNHQGDAA